LSPAKPNEKKFKDESEKTWDFLHSWARWEVRHPHPPLVLRDENGKATKVGDHTGNAQPYPQATVD
jgi:hypothetical protein